MINSSKLYGPLIVHDTIREIYVASRTRNLCPVCVSVQDGRYSIPVHLWTEMENCGSKMLYFDYYHGWRYPTNTLTLLYQVHFTHPTCHTSKLQSTIVGSGDTFSKQLIDDTRDLSGVGTVSLNGGNMSTFCHRFSN